MHAISSYRGNRPTNKQTNRGDYNTLRHSFAIARSVIKRCALWISPSQHRQTTVTSFYSRCIDIMARQGQLIPPRDVGLETWSWSRDRSRPLFEVLVLVLVLVLASLVLVSVLVSACLVLVLVSEGGLEQDLRLCVC